MTTDIIIVFCFQEDKKKVRFTDHDHEEKRVCHSVPASFNQTYSSYRQKKLFYLKS